MTLVTGLFYLYALPDSQLSVGWLTDREKAIAVDRIKVNSQGIGNYSWQWYQVKEALLDPRTYLYFLFSSFMNIPNGGIGTFGSLIINVSQARGASHKLITPVIRVRSTQVFIVQHASGCY